MIAQDEATSVVWGMPGAAAHAGVCSAVLPLDQIAPKIVRLFLRRPVVTPLDYEYLRKLLKERSGLVLSADKQYLVESRLLPVARKAGLATLADLVAEAQAAGRRALIVEVVEAMTTNESFFFRDKMPFEHFRDTIMPALLAARAQRAPHPHLVRGRLHRPGALFARHVPEGDGHRTRAAGASRSSRTDLSTEVLEKAKSRHLQPVRGAARPADPDAGQVLHPGRRHLADRAGDPRHGAVSGRSTCSPTSPISARFDVVFCRNVLIYFDQATKIDVLDRIAGVTERDGFLVLGAAETVVGLTDRFKPIPDKRGLYGQPGGLAMATS